MRNVTETHGVFHADIGRKGLKAVKVLARIRAGQTGVFWHTRLTFRPAQPGEIHPAAAVFPQAAFLMPLELWDYSKCLF